MLLRKIIRGYWSSLDHVLIWSSSDKRPTYKCLITLAGLTLVVAALTGGSDEAATTASQQPASIATSKVESEATPPKTETATPGVNTSPDRTPATVISVGDGNTIEVARAGQPNTTIRLACIDAPETRQPQGAQASNRLREILPREADITFRTVDTDRYGRTVAEVYQGGNSINLQLVQEGYAVVYRDYLDGCAESRDRYLEAEASAKQQGLGFWSQPEGDRVMPWDWRQGQRPAGEAPAYVPSPVPTPVAQPTPTQPQAQTSSNCDPSYPGICLPVGSPDLNCGDISDRRFAVRPPDPHGFDRDGDGVGCES